MNPAISIDLLKMRLKDVHKMFVLDDMTGPVDLNGGVVFASKSRVIEESDTVESLAKNIAIDGQAFAFYRFDSNSDNKPVIRYATVNVTFKS